MSISTELRVDYNCGVIGIIDLPVHWQRYRIKSKNLIQVRLKGSFRDRAAIHSHGKLTFIPARIQEFRDLPAESLYQCSLRHENFEASFIASASFPLCAIHRSISSWFSRCSRLERSSAIFNCRLSDANSSWTLCGKIHKSTSSFITLDFLFANLNSR